MAELQRRKVLPHSADTAYAVVADVSAYAKFLPWLQRVEILSQTTTQIDAVLHTATHGVHNHYTTRFVLQPPAAVRMVQLDGPMRTLDGQWNFVAHDANRSTVGLDLHYEFSNPMVGLLFGHAFRHAIDEMLDHVAARADALNG